MSALSDSIENKLLDHSLGTASYTAPAAVYVGLFTSDPSTGSTSENLEAGIMTNEVSGVGTGYLRQIVTFDAASGGSATTSATVTFPTATADWGTITHVAVIDSLQTDSAGQGEVIYYGLLDTAKIIETGDTFQITTSNLTITLA
jgi:hypothetical protein